MNAQLHDFLTGAEFSRVGNIPMSRFVRLVKSGQLKPVGKLGRASIFSRADLLRLPEILAGGVS